MKIIHSFWSKSYFHGRWGQESKIHMDLYSFALSYHYAKSLYKNISLVTDLKGLSLFSCIPYDDIVTDLENINHINPGFWTAGKIRACEMQTKPFIHIDGDVFLMEKKIRKILSDKWDVAVQMREIGQHYNDTYPQAIRKLQEVYPWAEGLGIFNYAYNNGILGFRNMGFRDKYVYEYFDLLYMLEICHVQFPPKADPNIVVEQSLLTRLSSYHNVHVKELITLNDMEKEGLFEYAEKIGFVHLWGNSKYQDYWHEKVKAKLKEVNPKLYKAVTNKINSL